MPSVPDEGNVVGGSAVCLSGFVEAVVLPCPYLLRCSSAFTVLPCHNSLALPAPSSIVWLSKLAPSLCCSTYAASMTTLLYRGRSATLSTRLALHTHTLHGSNAALSWLSPWLS